ncbi:hypothetical protein [Streptomyces sp. H27-H5]|uniref:hypothetical protein n=1 Tax=Streptomyces sp. H27-H5 TaxID=2996460 RepID=UPI00226DF655|nr:hypothetical protein [Streptomyces sp. H27-H5]MCY0961813.1 hypothetical protein [Streptomyces sp. H27-H5]
MTPRLLLARLAATVAALALIFGLAAPAALAQPAAAAPAAAQKLPTVDWWNIGKCATWFIPNAPKSPDGPAACIKTAIKGGKAVNDATGKVMSAAAQKVADSVLGDAAKSMAEFVGEFMRIGLGWWLMTPSVQVKDSGVLGDTASSDPTKKLSLHGLMMGIGAGIATLLVMIQGIKTIIQRKGTPLAHLVQGLMVNMLVSAAGIAIIDALLIASDELTKMILYVGFGGDDVPDRMAVMLLPALVNPIGLLAVALIVFLVGGVQIVMLFLRQAAIPIQALILPIAGAGQLGGESTRQWLPRTFTAIMVIIIYKPIAALIISVGFVEMAYGNGIIDFIRGIVTLGLSVVALKSLFALFAPIGASIGGAVSSGGGFAGALSMAGNAMASQMGGAGGGGGGDAPTSASQHAADMDRSGPASGGGGGGDDGDSGSSAVRQANIPQQGGSPEAATEAATTAAETASTGASTAATTATAAAPPVAIAMVAAEAGQAAIKKAGGTVGGTE